MYLLNTSDSALTSGGIFFAKDTELDGNDGVLIYAQAKNNGFYMQTDNYKVFMNMKVPDGLQNYVTENYHQSGDEANGQTITNSMSAKSSAESASSRVTIPVEKTTYQLENTQLQFSNVELTKLSSDQPSTAVDNSVVVSDFKLTPSGQAQTLVTRTIMQRVPAIIQKLKRMIILVIQPGTIISGIKKPRITVSGCIF